MKQQNNNEGIEKERKYDLVDLIAGIGMGLCFSKYFPVGILLIMIGFITALFQLKRDKQKLKGVEE